MNERDRYILAKLYKAFLAEKLVFDNKQQQNTQEQKEVKIQTYNTKYDRYGD